MMGDPVKTIVLTVDTSNDRAESDWLTRELLAEVLVLEVDHAGLAAGGTPQPGTKGADAATVSTIIVSVASSHVLSQLAKLLRDWVARGKDRKVTVRDGDRFLEITGASTADRKQVIDSFFAGPGS
jgi:hypothetical protein